MALPDWLASMTQVPAGDDKVTKPVLALTVQPEVDDPSTL